MNKYGKLALIFFQSAIVAAALAFLFNLMGNMLLRHKWTALVSSTSLVADSTQTFEVKTEFKAQYYIRVCPWDRAAFPPMSIRWWTILQKDTIGIGTWTYDSSQVNSEDTCFTVGQFKSWANDTYQLFLSPTSAGTLSAKPPTVGLEIGVAPEFRKNYELRAKLSQDLTWMVVWLATALAIGAAALFIVAFIKR